MFPGVVNSLFTCHSPYRVERTKENVHTTDMVPTIFFAKYNTLLQCTVADFDLSRRKGKFCEEFRGYAVSISGTGG